MKGNGLMFQTNTSSDINDFEKGYAVVNNLTGDFASGWHTPSIDELIDLYENRTVVDDSSKLPPAEPVALIRHKWPATSCGKPLRNASHRVF